jgi:hypothetical protein
VRVIHLPSYPPTYHTSSPTTHPQDSDIRIENVTARKIKKNAHFPALKTGRISTH